MKIELRIEPAPSCTQATLDALLASLRSIGFKPTDIDGGILVSRDNLFPTVDSARKAVGAIVDELGVVILDSRVAVLAARRRSRRSGP